jgi:ditrans,polycis-polyprenyl diphosphate synthase
MELMEEKINELLENRNVINKVNCRINFWGNLDMLTEPARLAAQKLMAGTAQNTGLVFSVCMPYNSTSQIVNSVNELCKERRDMNDTGAAGWQHTFKYFSGRLGSPYVHRWLPRSRHCDPDIGRDSA